MRLFTYVTRWDHGFAPNPFHGFCTLATCKPAIRKTAVEGDWILGTGSAKRGYAKRAIFLMRVGEILPFDAYWRDRRFFSKRPVLSGSYKLRFGDNIYHRDLPGGPWIQEDSRHSKDHAEPNEINLKRDTGTTDRVLISDEFTYWGDRAPAIPPELARFCTSRRGYTYAFSELEIVAFLDWVSSLNQQGRIGDPVEWAPRYVRHWR